MNINISADGIELTPQIREYIAKKVESISKFIGNADEALMQVVLERTTNHHQNGDIFRTAFNLTSGRTFHAEATNQDIFASIDAAQDDLERELSSHKDKRQTMWKRGSLQIKNALKGLGGVAKRMKFRR